MKKLTDFDSLDDFGYTSKVDSSGKVEYITCDPSFSKLVDSDDENTVYTNGDLTPGRFQNLDTILSGGNLSITIDDSLDSGQAELALDYSVVTSLAFLGSVYSTVLIGINKIHDNYPNGFAIITAVTGVFGVNTLMFNNADTYMYGSKPFSISDYTDFELVQSFNNLYDQTFAINSQTSITGGTFSVLFLDGPPTVGTGYDHIVQPKTSTLDKLYSDLSSYEIDLLVPPFNRTNYFPRDPAAVNNVIFEGTAFDTFKETELSWASLADNEETNFLWRKLYPDGQKNLDSADGIMKKLILSFATNFDNIKRYQDQLKYQQTIGYSMYNHISKDLVENLANQWNWLLGHNLKQDDYSEYIYSTYENYITGQSQQKLSGKDVNFEIWRRVLANLVTLYKKKGTKEAIKYLTNIYGLPEALLFIDELVKIASSVKDELIESVSNIVVPMSGSMYYIDSIGSAQTLDYRVIANTKYLNVTISPYDAINFDFYDWGWEHHPDIVNINNDTVKLSSATEITQYEFFKRVYSNTIKSDGSARYDSIYPLLEREERLYYANSVNKYTLQRLSPYMDFLDDNWNVLLTNLVPASSKLIAIGNLYKNPMWKREKHQWNISELDPKDLPFNEDILLDPFVLSGTVKKTNAGVITASESLGTLYQTLTSATDAHTTTSSKGVSVNGIITSPENTGSYTQQLYGIDDLADPVCEYIPEISDLEILDLSYSSETFSIGAPMLTTLAGQTGTTDYTNYNSNSLVITNETSFDIVFSAFNLSDSGFTNLNFELFEKKHDESVYVDEDTEYSIMFVEGETETHGRYKVSSVENIDVYDYIQINSTYLPFINQVVQVVYINSGTSQIRTKPKIGLFSLPMGSENNVVDWIDVLNSGALLKLSLMINQFEIPVQEIIDIMMLVVILIEDHTLPNASILKQTMDEFGWSDHIQNVIVWFTDQEIGIIYGTLLVLEFINGNSNWSIDSSHIELLNAVATVQTKATFYRIVNFFNWMIPDQTISYSNYATNIELGTAEDVSFSGRIGDTVTVKNVHLSFDGSSKNQIDSNLSTFSVLEVPTMVWVCGSTLNDGLWSVTASSISDLAIVETLQDESAGNMIWIWEWLSGHTISSQTIDFSSINSGDTITISNSALNDGSYTAISSSYDYIDVQQDLSYESEGQNVTVYRSYYDEHGDFALPVVDHLNRGDENTGSTTGTVRFGGLNVLNANILMDKNEYFYRTNVRTHAPISWGDIPGFVRYPIPEADGTYGSIIDSGYELQYWNGIKYYGNYFMYMLTPNVPVASIVGLIDGVSDDSSVESRWNGVGDSDRLELQYMPVPAIDSPFSTYEDILEENWVVSATTSNIQSLNNVGDDYIYTIQTTLEPDTYYWWRVKNFRSKVNMFGYNLEYFTSTQPEVFQTGTFAGGGGHEGEIEIPASPPILPPPKPPAGGEIQGL